MKLTLVEKSNGPLTKTIHYQDGGIKKDSSECWLSEGKVTQLDTTLEKMSEGLRKLKSNQALIHGINGHRQVKILSEKKYTGQADTITRTRKHFSYPEGEGSAFFDHDPKPGQKSCTKEQFIETLAGVFLEIGEMGHIWTPSTSSCIYKDGKELIGQEGGMHIYFAVKNAPDLPRFSEVLCKRLWLAGHGYIFITKDGKQLERTIFDKAVFSPERLDFVAGADCKDGLEQRLPDPIYTPGNILDTSLLPDLTGEEESEYKRLVDEVKRKTAREAGRIREEYVQVEVEKLIKEGTSRTDAKRIVETRIGGNLLEGDILFFDRVGKKMVAQVLSDPATFDKESLRDPLEPDYGPHKAIFYANSNDGRPVIYSQAHGGRLFFIKSKDVWQNPTPLPVSDNISTVQGYQLELLPEPVKTAAAEVARFAKVPEVSPAVVGLSCIATAVGKKALVVERPGLEHHPALFQVLIAASGERKSPAFSNMTFPFDQWTTHQKEHYWDLMREVKASNMAIDSALGGLKSKAKKAGPEDIDSIAREMKSLEERRINEPPYPSLFTTDTTEQRLFQKMHDRNGAYAVMSGEGRQVLDAIMGKYSGNGRTGDGIYLAGITGDTITRDRVGGDNGPEERLIQKPCLNVCIMSQPDKYMEIASHPSLRESGALARIWPVWLPSLVGGRIEKENEPGLKPSRMEAYNKLIRNLLEANPPEDEMGNACHKAYLSQGASEARRVFHNTIERMMAEGKELEDVRDIASKAVSQTCKLALVLHLADDPELLNQQKSTISLETWAIAQALGTYHLQEAVRVQRAAFEDKAIEAARRTLKWIEQEQLQEITAKDVYTNGPRPRTNAKQVSQTIELLIDYEYLKSENRDNKRKPVYVVNPLWQRSQKSQKSQGVDGK